MTSPEPPGRKWRVAVLMGGNSTERTVSLSTGKMILKALDPQQYSVTAIDTQDILPLPGSPDPLPASEERAQAQLEAEHAAAMPEPAGLPVPAGVSSELVRPDGEKPDVVFIALHGKGGEDGTIQALLELLGLPYTGSGVLASALAMDKSMSKRLFRAEGIPVIPDVQVRRDPAWTEAALIEYVCASLGGFPVFVKPNAEGSTFGCTLVKSPDQLPEAVALALRYDPLALIEQYVRGMEITVGVLENPEDASDLQPLPVIEIVPKNEYYDYESKYAEGGSEHIIPARLPEATLRRAQELAVRCHQVLGCRGMSRTDLIVAGEQLFVLEVNTIPGMTPTSLLPQAADYAGISFPTLLDRLIACALNKGVNRA
ncbi:MAG TPA: D-alanine--D-alanine ligase [Chthonomonadaceae bacterium]|nr:D-alanine--D-alanine ligase [Chthonomonadaceae bacterium]